MSEPPPDDPSGDLWNDVPLFRELQRVLSSSSGPVNWELARQVAVAAAIEGGDPAPGADDARAFEDAVRLAELQVAGFTGLDAPADVASVEVVRRAEWVRQSLEDLRTFIEPAAAKMGDAVAKAQAQMLPEGAEGAGAMAGLSQLLGQVSPLLLGAQIGGVVGSLAQQVLGRYDIALPRPDAGHALLFVVPNVAAFERDWSLDPKEFRTWVAIHEVTHRFGFSRPWILGRFRALLDDYLSTLQLDVQGLQERLGSLDPSNPEAMQDVIGSGGEGLFGVVMDDDQRLKLGRIQAFVAAAEGYGDHVQHALGARLLSSTARIEEAMRRYREDEDVDLALERMLGIEIPRERYGQGTAFCDSVAEQTDEATLARMWDDASSMPSLPEIEEPILWLSRIA